jgi:hypothetical protein
MITCPLASSASLLLGNGGLLGQTRETAMSLAASFPTVGTTTPPASPRLSRAGRRQPPTGTYIME